MSKDNCAPYRNESEEILRSARKRGVTALLQSLALIGISVLITLAGLELALRVYNTMGRRMVYHDQLGWVPRPGKSGWFADWSSNVDAAGFRVQPDLTGSTERPILAVGDSFTFGDEVGDKDTWGATLEEMLGRRVLNAGVGAYGIDQAVLRAKLLLEDYEPETVILAFIADDISRTEFSYYPYGRGWKPYFEFENGALVLRNVPVPRGPGPRPDQPLRQLLSRSLLADQVLRRVASDWWRDPGIERIHNNGVEVSAALLAELDSLVESRGGRFVAVALATNGRVGSNELLPVFVQLLREQDIAVLDLSSEVLSLPPERLVEAFRPHGHYSPTMNRRIAQRLADYLEVR